MATPKHNANGHRRRELRKRVLAEENTCALCDKPIDKTIGYITGQHGPNCPSKCTGCIPDPMRAEVDEDIPRSRGGSPYDRTNCHALHRTCNQFKSDQTLAEARAKYNKQKTVHPITASPIW